MEVKNSQIVLLFVKNFRQDIYCILLCFKVCATPCYYGLKIVVQYGMHYHFVLFPRIPF